VRSFGAWYESLSEVERAEAAAAGENALSPERNPDRRNPRRPRSSEEEAPYDEIDWTLG
jgi:hypothetical protein